MNMNPELGKQALDALLSRDGKWSLVILNSGKECVVLNIVYGEDMGADYMHITTNICPSPKETSDTDFFLADEIVEIRDMESNRSLWSLSNGG